VPGDRPEKGQLAMTAPSFRLVTNLGDFALTVIDERCIIAKAPADPDLLLLIDGDELAIRLELHQQRDGIWRPDSPDELLLLRRHRGSVQVRSEEDAGLRQVIVDALVEEVTAWATDCPVLLATAAALNRAKGDR
jgi:hypothetical protein